jgi:hypothetical protein
MEIGNSGFKQPLPRPTVASLRYASRSPNQIAIWRGGADVLWLEIVIHFQEGIGIVDDAGVGVDDPGEAVEDSGEGICNWDVIMDSETIFIAATFGHTPAHDLCGSGDDLGLTGGILPIGLLAGDTIPEASGIDDGEEAIA